VGNYRESRNIIQSCIEKIRTILLENNFTNVTVAKSFKQIYDAQFDPQLKTVLICVRIGITIYDSVEVGSYASQRKPLLLLDLFCSEGGQLEDLKDLLVSNLKYGFDYKEYSTSGGVTSDAVFAGKATNGRIRVNNITETEVNLGDDKADLNIRDRYRSLITLNCTKNSIEE
jgi:hypothetical protein